MIPICSPNPNRWDKIDFSCSEKCIENLEFDRKRSNLYWNWLKDFFNLLINFFDHLINYFDHLINCFDLLINLIDLLIKNRSKVIEISRKEIKIRSKSQSRIWFCRWILNRTDIDNQIWTAWNLNHWQFTSGTLIS